MRPVKKIERLIKASRYKAGPETYNKALGRFLQAVDEHKKQKQAAEKPYIWRIIMKNHLTKLAAAAAVIVIAALIITFQSSTSGVAWGALVEKIESIQSVVYHMTTNVKMEGMPQELTSQTAIAYYSSEYGTRAENYMNDKLSMIMYLNPKENVYVTVLPEQKKFMKVTNRSQDELKRISEKDDPRVTVRQMMSTEYKHLGRDKINGIDVEGIECTGPKVMGGMFEDATARLWVERGTDYPVRIEIDGIVSGGQMEMSMVMDDFQWNVELDPALFVPDIPDDYTSSEMNIPQANEETAINALRKFAEITGGRYPSNLAYLTLMKEVSEELTKKYGIELMTKTDDYQSELQSLLPVGMFYTQMSGAGKEAVYYGDKITADNPELVLLRWKVSDGVYRVIFGNLTATDVNAEELAELEKPFLEQ
jgi:outer membrane lipoprotein-sorting protein